MKNLIKKINWNKAGGLVPTIIKDVNTGVVLMLGYMNKQALEKTLETKNVWFYSRSKKRLWMKGETSKNILNVVDMAIDCDGDALLVGVKPFGPVCHKGTLSCFNDSCGSQELLKLFKTIQCRKEKSPKNSYTASLFKAGLDKICLKVAEEALEVVQAAQKQTKERLIEESVDLIYHLFVLLSEKNISMQDINPEIKRRSK